MRFALLLCAVFCGLFARVLGQMGIVLCCVELDWTGPLCPSPVPINANCPHALFWLLGRHVRMSAYRNAGLGLRWHGGDRNVDCGVMRQSDRTHAMSRRVQLASICLKGYGWGL